MITKLLRRFCSEEVRLMLTHLEEHPEDFDIHSSSKWPMLFGDLNQNGTFIEQLVASNIRRKSFKHMKREQFKQNIVKQTIAPEEKDAYKELMQLTPGSFVTTSNTSILQQMQRQQQALFNSRQISLQQQLGLAQAQPMHLKDPQ
jgi:hypothetical protein